MTRQEARRILEATTPFEVRGGQVWLRDLRWLRAVGSERSEEAAAAAPGGTCRTATSAEVAQPPLGHLPSDRRAVAIA
ncbi:MAG: hypothetical protein K0A98_10050 [Trueperaceae bacterium]|nr:hypothetical protein [Trueperaceae bacterium]